MNCGMIDPGRWIHCGPGGAGNYVKMIHNGMGYGMMQAHAEGLALLDARTEFGLDVAGIAWSWRHGSASTPGFPT